MNSRPSRLGRADNRSLQVPAMETHEQTRPAVPPEFSPGLIALKC